MCPSLAPLGREGGPRLCCVQKLPRSLLRAIWLEGSRTGTPRIPRCRLVSGDAASLGPVQPWGTRSPACPALSRRQWPGSSASLQILGEWDQGPHSGGSTGGSRPRTPVCGAGSLAWESPHRHRALLFTVPFPSGLLGATAEPTGAQEVTSSGVWALEAAWRQGPPALGAPGRDFCSLGPEAWRSSGVRALTSTIARPGCPASSRRVPSIVLGHIEPQLPSDPSSMGPRAGSVVVAQLVLCTAGWAGATQPGRQGRGWFGTRLGCGLPGLWSEAAGLRSKLCFRPILQC